jgi:hypothetical protein
MAEAADARAPRSAPEASVTGVEADDAAGGASARVDEPFDEPPPGEQPVNPRIPATPKMPGMPSTPTTPTTTEPSTSEQAGLGTRNHLQFMSS